jgi:hypothetical protein
MCARSVPNFDNIFFAKLTQQNKCAKIVFTVTAGLAQPAVTSTAT